MSNSSENSGCRPGPLTGFRIIDLTTVVLGPYATQLLGDLGAEVIKVESPDGDVMRHAGPHVSPGMAPIYMTINRNKRSIVLDLTREDARDVLRQLVKTADGFIHNIRSESMARLGFEYEAVAEIKPDIVYCHAVGFGSGGPYEGRPAYDDLIQAGSGIPAMFSMDGDDSEPRYYPGLIADKTTGLHSAYAMLAGLLHRERTGEGQFIEIPMLESMVSFNSAEKLFGRVFVPPKEPHDYTRLSNPYRKPYKTKDGYVGMTPYSLKHWRDTLRQAGCEAMMDDPRFSTYTQRTKHISLLYKKLEEIAPQKTTDEWLSVLGELGVPCMRVHTLDSVLEEQQLRDTGLIEEREHATEGPYIAINNPVKFTKSPAKIYCDPPLLGQDTIGLCEELGLGAKEIERLKNAGAFGDKQEY